MKQSETLQTTQGHLCSSLLSHPYHAKDSVLYDSVYIECLEKADV